MADDPCRENIGLSRCGGEWKFQDENLPESILAMRFGIIRPSGCLAHSGAEHCRMSGRDSECRGENACKFRKKRLCAVVGEERVDIGESAVRNLTKSYEFWEG